MIAVFALVAAQSFASTPERAALAAVYSKGTPSVVRRINVSGRYAAVLIDHAFMEGSAISAPILVQRFSFGWQPLDVLDFRCRLAAHALGERMETELMREMPPMNDEKVCGAEVRDAGPRDQIEALRKTMRGPLVPYVAVSGDWAMGEWYGAGGGAVLFQRRRGSWQRVLGGGGVIGDSLARTMGVPQESWCTLGIVAPECNKH